ncbi:hypothetical protein [Inhella crocodyli]|uniref:PD(D/E)XK endonuclease domain-containing protein n=1 Tax=Inhella crocodyli TaxID=2499851 RepID=A0A3S2UHR7_9BURK|nr:hypothetical protein [Inhella crocodyli]RVT86241.1 hypothetical protein EOD73_09420 [Inhella crocodyli]
MDPSASETPRKARRQDTSLESEGAEFLVLGNLLVEGIVAHKTYTNNPGYDLVAIDPERGTSARIQVKSRWRTGAEGFIIKNFDTDFVVVALLNRGSKDGKREIAPPEFYVLPAEEVRAASAAYQNAWGKLPLGRIPGFKDRLSDWGAIRAFLQREAR